MGSTSKSETKPEGHAEREQVIFLEFEWIRDACRRLPAKHGLMFDGQWKYMTEEALKSEAKSRGTVEQFKEALKERRRGKRLVAIVAHGGVLYEFV